MAILTPAELRASREAIEAGVDDVTDAAATAAIRDAEATLNLSLGYRVADARTEVTVVSPTGTLLSVPARVRTVSAVSESYDGGTAASVTPYEVRSSGFDLFRRIGWRQDYTVTITGTFGYEATDDQYVLGQRFVKLLAVRMLQSTETDGNIAAPAGALLTGYSSENADFRFFTPDGETTGYADLDKLLDQIGRHPNKGKGGLYTIALGGGLDDGVTFDQIIQGAHEEIG